ncbi:MAG TPA: hypothetical protein DCZ94_20190 [Lentisphaeria bacterium]|nr:MAG: hypothetical protein A2X48_02575 [Lentisphaerae bacterium GWF2_49_21]HBC89267.1 hypothetical protein [Lentisphaeria bacterium]
MRKIKPVKTGNNPKSSSRTRKKAGSSDRYHGFSLENVTWGYRETFENAIENLYGSGMLGKKRRAVTSKFFEVLKSSDCCQDHVIREFLDALNLRNRWIMDIPALFSDLADMGMLLSSRKVFYGIRYFEIFASGGMGATPAEIAFCLNWMRYLLELDEELAMAFLAGYHRLLGRMRQDEIDRYVEVALQMFQRSSSSACAFLRGELSSSETYIVSITQECRLADVSPDIRSIYTALTGEDCEVAELGLLDSDELILRGTAVLSIRKHLYLPVRLRRFGTSCENRNWYILCGIAAAALFNCNSFSRMHGGEGFRTCEDLSGASVARTNLFQIIEFARTLHSVRGRWPGACRILEWGLAEDFRSSPDMTGPEGLFQDCMRKSSANHFATRLAKEACACRNSFDSLHLAEESWINMLLPQYPAVSTRRLQPSGFISDFLFPVSLSNPPNKKKLSRQGDGDVPEKRISAKDILPGHEGTGDATEGRKDGKDVSGEDDFIYDEWDSMHGEYHSGWCRLQQKRIDEPAEGRILKPWLDDARRVKALFERLKPEMIHREKRLAEGDEINTDMLLTHILERHREPSPRAMFYEKPMVNRRDLAVLVLIDLSGSTGDNAESGERIIDLEKEAAVILGQGLASLGDNFAMCGFSSNGRENCEYFVFKEFAEKWDEASIGSITAAKPCNSTRIGPALRHSGFLLASQESLRKLIILVTDGKPMDQDYDPNTRYAHCDVRMACIENERMGVQTLAISTQANSLPEMELMFPRRRFVILPCISQLPKVLPGLYLKLTF